MLANFSAAGTTERVRASAACSVAVMWTSDTVEVALSDPSRTTGKLDLAFPTIRTTGVVSADPSITVVSGKPLTLSVALSGTKGATQRVTLTR